MRLSYESALEVLYFAGGILLVGVAPYLSTRRLSSDEVEVRVREER